MCRSLCFALLLFAATLCVGEDRPRGEVFGGYSYANLDTQGITNRLNANGWQASATGRLNKWAGVEADIAGHYASLNVFGTTVPVRQYSFLAGPRLTYRYGSLAPFAHALFGVDRVSANVLGLSSGYYNAFAAAWGGGIDLTVRRRIAVRLLQGDFLLSRHSEAFGDATQKSFRVATGLVFRFGLQPEAPPTIVPSVSPPPGIPVPSIGLQGRSESPYGLKITDLQPGSPAERAGLRVGDIVTAVDGRPFKTGEEIAAELARHQPGTTVTILYLRGYWESEVTVTVGVR